MSYYLNCSDGKPETQNTWLSLESVYEQHKTPRNSYYLKKKEIYSILILFIF